MVTMLIYLLKFLRLFSDSLTTGRMHRCASVTKSISDYHSYVYMHVFILLYKSFYFSIITDIEKREFSYSIHISIFHRPPTVFRIDVY